MSLKIAGFFTPFAFRSPVTTSTTSLLYRYNSTVFSPAITTNQTHGQGDIKSRKTLEAEQQFKQFKLQEQRSKNLDKNHTRQWKTGDVYSPHDLSPSEMRKWRKRSSPSSDAFDALGLNPLHQYKNFAIMSEYMSEMGRIKHSSETGLRPVNQRRLSKAIRRAVGLGLMPSVHRHPEVLLKENNFEY